MTNTNTPADQSITICPEPLVLPHNRKQANHEPEIPNPTPHIRIDNVYFDYWRPALGQRTMAVWDTLDRLKNQKLGYAYPSYQRLAKSLGMGTTTISEAIKTLKQHNLLQVIHSTDHKQTNHYITKSLDINEEKRIEICQLIHQHQREPLTDSLHFWHDWKEKQEQNQPPKKTNQNTNQSENENPTESTKTQAMLGDKGGTPVQERGTPVGETKKQEFYKNDLPPKQSKGPGAGPEEAAETKIAVASEKESLKAPSESEAERSVSQSVVQGLAASFDAMNSERKLNTRPEQTRSILSQLTKKYGVQYIYAQAGLLTNRVDAGSVKIPMAYFRAACSGNYAGHEGSSQEDHLVNYDQTSPPDPAFAPTKVSSPEEPIVRPVSEKSPVSRRRRLKLPNDLDLSTPNEEEFAKYGRFLIPREDIDDRLAEEFPLDEFGRLKFLHPTLPKND